MDLRPVLYIIGILLSTLAASMSLPMLADLHIGHADWKVFFFCIIFTLFFGGLLVLTNNSDSHVLTTRHGFLIVALSWTVLPLFAAFPLWFSELNLSFTDAFFEAVSGITTTGSTIITTLDSAPRGILLWRALLQWLGGIGIIIMALSILPFLKIGGMQMFQTELSESEKALPRAASLAKSIGIIYIALSLACIICYKLAGLTMFDAVTFALPTIATGGFAPYDSSFGYFSTSAPLVVGCIFMVLGGLPFILYLKASRGNLNPLLADSQVRWFLSIVAIAVILITVSQVFFQGRPFFDALVSSAFNLISNMTGTGFASEDYGQWNRFAIAIIFFLMFVGGCAGSTTCGIKIFRFQVLYAVTNTQLRKLMHPHGVFIPHYGGRAIPEGVPVSVMGFFFLYAVCFAVLAVALSLVGLDFVTAISGAATSISNVGPGFGEVIGPVGNFQPLPDSAKWILCAGMILGRLELFTMLVLLSPNFWRR